MKKCLAPLKEKKKDMELIIASMGKGLSLSETIEKKLANAEGKKHDNLTKNLYHFINKARHEFMVEYDSICFDCSCLDVKQYALKMYMNTFYGTAGDSKFPFFFKGFQIKYGDTDSLYLVLSERCFQKYDEAYDSGNGILKEEYWSKMMNISNMEVMEKLHNEVNDFLRKDNRSSYLKMAYGEVLFLVVFTGKKKYYSIPYESKLNFNRKPFIQEKSDKNNKSVQRFILQMQDRHTREEADVKWLIKRSLTPKPYLYEISELGKCFEYVVVENNSSNKIRNKMEYPEVVRRLGKKIDINYYLKTIVSLCAQFINYDDSYQPSSEIVLEALKKLKDDNKVGDNKADDGMDEDDVDKNNVDEEEIDEDEVSKIRDVLVPKSAEKWIRRQEESIRLKLSSLLKEISEVDIGYRENMYKLVTKKRAMYNGKEGDFIYIGWLLAYMMSQAEKVLINLPDNLPEKLLAHTKKRFGEVLLAPVFICSKVSMVYVINGDIKKLAMIGALAGKDITSAPPTEII
ncbi:DNA polymerase family B-domain-containing protein [Rhizophagus clarus]|nr:DNA polymerase family B-domain-containing protein [Rhizophagus clarus]